MIAEPQTKYITADEFYELALSPKYANRVIDLVEGVIVDMGNTGGEHGELITQISGIFRDFVRPRKLARMATGETGFILGKNAQGRDTVRALDVALVLMERAPNGLPKKMVPFAPDLAVEVISPSNAADDMHQKVRELLTAGTRIVWLVYPPTQTVEVHTKDGARTYTSDETLDGGDVLPGFTVEVREIFDI